MQPVVQFFGYHLLSLTEIEPFFQPFFLNCRKKRYRLIKKDVKKYTLIGFCLYIYTKENKTYRLL